MTPADDIHVVYEKKATPEQVEQARKLHLPDNFFLYEDAVPCPGCQGCESDTAGQDEVVVFSRGVMRRSLGSDAVLNGSFFV